MAKGGCDYSGLKKLKDRLNATREQTDEFLESCTKELAQRLLVNIIINTPTGRYKKGSGKVGGTLKRGWTAGRDIQAPEMKEYVNSLQVEKSGSTSTITIGNPVEYTSYVEYGHRTRGGEGHVDGRFMLTNAEKLISRQAEAILEAKVKKALNEVINDK